MSGERVVPVDVMPDYQPSIYPVMGGYHAAGIGWAVFGRTADEAIARFRQRAARYRVYHETGKWPAKGERG